MKKIIALYRSCDQGKTATLNLVIDLLTVATTECAMPDSQPSKKDRRATFTYNDKIVSICTGGDDANTIKANEDYFAQKNCDVAITASRSRGITRDLINKMGSTFGIKPIWRKNKTMKMFR